MDGRLENSIKREKRIKNILNDLPDYVTDFYYYLTSSGKSSATCLDMIMKIHAFHNWINDKQITIGNVTEATLTRYLHEKSEKITADGEIKSTSYSYRKTLIACLKNYFKYLHSKKIVTEDVSKDLISPKHKDNIDRKKITTEDLNNVVRLIENTKEKMKDSDCDSRWVDRDMLIINLFMKTGMRATALSEINLNDVNFETRELNVTDKRNKHHVYYLDDKTIGLMEIWLKGRKGLLDDFGLKDIDPLFINKQRKRASYKALYCITKKYTDGIIGDGISPHKLRGAFATLLYNKTHDIEFVRQAIGHEDISTTQRYIVNSDIRDTRRKATDIMSAITNL